MSNISRSLILMRRNKRDMCVIGMLGCRLDQEEKRTLPESRQAFEVTATRISELVNLVFSRQTGFLMQASIY